MAASPTSPNQALSVPGGQAGGSSHIASVLRGPRSFCAVTSRLCSSILWSRNMSSTIVAASAFVRLGIVAEILAACTTAFNTFTMSHPCTAAWRGMFNCNTLSACRAVMQSRWLAFLCSYASRRGMSLWAVRMYCSRAKGPAWHV